MTNPNLDLGLTIMQRARREMQALSLADGPSHPGSALIIDPAASAAQLVQDAMRHSQNGDPALAHLHWQAACVLAPDNKVAALRLAQSLLPLTGPRATCDALQALVERYPDFVPAQLGLAAHLSGTKDYSLALQETETILQAAPDNPVALIIRANCLRQLRRDAEAVQALTRAMQSNPDIPSPRLKLAGLLFELGRFVDVVALCGDAAPTDIRPLALHVFAARAQFRLGQRADAARRFSDLILAAPLDVKRRLVQIHEHLGALDFRGAYRQITDLLARFPHDLAGYGLAVRCLCNLGCDAALQALLDNAPPDLRQSRQFQLGVLLQASLFQFRVEDCRKIIAAHDQDGLPVDQGLPLVEALWIHGDRQLAETRLTGLLTRFPDHMAVMRKSITIFGSRDPAESRRIKSECLARLSPLGRCQLLGSLQANILTLEERQSVVDWMLEPGQLQTDAQHRSFLLGFQYETDTPVIDTLLANYHAPTSFFALIRPSLEARSTGRSMPATKGDFSRICLQSAQLARQVPDVPKALQDMAAALTGILTDQTGPGWMDSADNPAAALDLCDWIAARIRSGQPTAVIRIGDGEGRFLPYRADHRDKQADDQAQVQRDPWWGAELVNPAQASGLSTALLHIIGRADVLGIPPMSRLCAELAWPTAFSHRDCRGLTAIFDALSSQKPGGLVGSCNLHADLDRWGLYGRLLADCKTVSVITCHDLSAFLQDRFQLSTRTFYQIPGEYRYRGRFQDQNVGHSNADPAARIYPDTFDAIMAQLDPAPGEVHLVGAGFLGKFFCDQIRTKGGIAIDIGSQADRWANHATRGYFKLG